MKRNAAVREAEFSDHRDNLCLDGALETSVKQMLQSGMDTFNILEMAVKTFHLKDCLLLGELIIQHKRAQGLI